MNLAASPVSIERGIICRCPGRKLGAALSKDFENRDKSVILEFNRARKSKTDQEGLHRQTQTLESFFLKAPLAQLDRASVYGTEG